MYKVHIAMLGGRRVGKTSLMAAMYGCFDEIVRAGGLHFDAEPLTSSRLTRRLTELQSWANDPSKPGGIREETDRKRFVFHLGSSEQNDLLQLEFTDYPGSLIQNNMSMVMRGLKKSIAIIVAIHTPALMEAKGDWKHLHKDHNNTAVNQRCVCRPV